jgi:hypothetical protein
MEAIKESTEQLADPANLRGAAAGMRALGHEIVAIYLEAAAAEIEGGREAFGTVVVRKSELEAQLRSLRANHEHTLDILARWRELLVAMQAEWPDDVRLHRALAGEHPMRPAPYERG